MLSSLANRERDILADQERLKVNSNIGNAMENKLNYLSVYEGLVLKKDGLTHYCSTVELMNSSG